MPREERRIIFDFGEAYRAIHSLCVQKEERVPPPGNITAMAFKDNDSSIVTVKITNVQTGVNSRREYSCDFVAAALLVYCRKCNMPLPQQGLKILEVDSEGVVLRVTIGSPE
jgi:hypothetical protein